MCDVLNVGVPFSFKRLVSSVNRESLLGMSFFPSYMLANEWTPPPYPQDIPLPRSLVLPSSPNPLEVPFPYCLLTLPLSPVFVLLLLPYPLFLNVVRFMEGIPDAPPMWPFQFYVLSTWPPGSGRVLWPRDVPYRGPPCKFDVRRSG